MQALYYLKGDSDDYTTTYNILYYYTIKWQFKNSL